MWSDLDRPPLNTQDLRDALTRQGEFWRTVDVVEETGSTNADLMARAEQLRDRAVLLAEFQSAGRGRHDRAWVSPPRSSVIASVLVRLPGVPVAAVGWLPLLTGVAVVDAVREVAKVDAALKWPNDVLVGGRKLCGVLVELASATPVPTAVIGFGLNVSQSAGDLPEAPLTSATSLGIEGAEPNDRGILARAVLRSLGSRLADLLDSNGDTFGLAADYRKRSATLGMPVRASMPGGKVLSGTAVDIDAEGRLLIQPDGAGGEPVAVSAGDITHLRGN
jgi:BirA family biotin operon repressor/biotin-[acetyl-CoA-carboxylase] ligase